MDSHGNDPKQTPRKGSSKVKEVRIEQEITGSVLMNGHNQNILGHNSSTVSRTSISSFKRSCEATGIQEEVVDDNHTTDLDTLILKAQQNYALSKQVIDKITNCNENVTTGQATFANLMEVRSTLTARVSEDHYGNSHRNHVKSEGQGITDHANNLKALSDNETNETNKRQPCDEYYSLKPLAQPESSFDVGSSSAQQPQPAVRAASTENSPSAVERVNMANNVQARGPMLAGDNSQASLASNMYVHTEAPVSDRQPPDVLREHLIQKLGFKPEPLPSLHSQREQIQEYNEQMEQLKKLQEKFSSKQFLKINQTSGSIVEDELAARSLHNESDATLQTEDGDEIHTFNRKQLLKDPGLEAEAELREKCSPSPVNPENSRVDTGHFNSKAGMANEMNIIHSLNIDASQASPAALDSPDMIQMQEPSLKQRGSKHEAYSSIGRKEYSQGLDTSLRYMAHLSPDQSGRDLGDTYRENNDEEAAERYMESKGEEANEHGHSIPSSIHSRSQSERIGEPTVFSLQLQKLYDNISIICPKFGLETGESQSNRIEVSPGLQHHSSVLAIQLYNQVCYLYQQVKELKLASLKKMDSKNEEMQLSNQAHIENNMLKMQVSNFQKESEFYKGQIDMLQEQLRISAYRDRENSSGYEQRIETMLQNINELEGRNAELERYVKQLEDHNKQLDDRNQSLLTQQQQMAEQKDELKIAPKEYMDFLSRKNENSEKVSQLQLELREIRQKLKMQEEIVGFEKDLNVTMKKQLENVQESKRKEIDMCKKDISRLQDTILQKNETIKVVTQQIDDFASLVSIEFPLFGQPGMKKDFNDSGINLSNQNKSPKFISMRKDTSNEVVMGLLNQFDSALGHSSFTDHVSSFDNEDNNVGRTRSKNQNMPFRGKSNHLANKKNNKKRGSSQTQAYSTYEKLFNLPQMVEQQIATTIFSDHILKDHKVSLQNKNKRITEQLEYVKELEEQMLLFKKQKDEFSKNQKQLTKDNEELKVKFSQLLDQFQEYVNESEKKTEEEQNQQKAIQDKLLNDLNCTIRELEEMSQNLQRDGEEKDQIIGTLQKERDILQKDMTFLKERFKQTEEHKEQLQNVKIQSLNEEINYLKKHYMVELDVLKQENKNLRMKMRAEQDKRIDYHEGNSLHPQFPQQSIKANERQNSFERQINYQNESGHPGFGTSFNGCEQQNTHESAGYMGQNMGMEPGEQSRFQGLKYPRNSSCNRDNTRPTDFEVQDNMGVQASTISRRGRDQGYVESEDHMYCGNNGNQAQPSYHNLRSKSHDRTLGASNSQLLEDKLEHSISNGALDLQQQNAGFYHKSHYDQKYDHPEEVAGLSYSASKVNNDSMYRNNQNQARDFGEQDMNYPMNRARMGPAPRSQHSMESRERVQIAQDDQVLRNNERLLLSAKKEGKLVTGLRKELDEKKQLIEFQNQEIVQLRFEFEELQTKANQDLGSVTQMQRSRLLMDIDGVVETLKSELERVKVNLWNEQQSQNDQILNMANNVVKEVDEEIHAVKSEDKLMSILSGRVKKMNRLLSLSSEILLLSTKQKYMPQQNRYGNSAGTSQYKPQSQEQSPILIQNQNILSKDVNLASRNSQVIFNQDNGGITSKSTFKQTQLDDEALIDENNSLKRTIYKYENTLAQLDSIFRRDNDKEECIYELKKLTENQLHQILRMQKEIDAHERRAKSQAPQYGGLQQENDVLKQEIAMLRDGLAHYDQNREQAQTQFSTDKIQLSQQIGALEQQLQEKARLLMEYQTSAKEKEAQLDEIRSRITVVAELFEKKPIKQRYSFEVLCDFIHDKAKRLFTKYENAIKDKKQMNDEKIAYYQRRVSALEIEAEKFKDSTNLIRVHVIPKLANLLNKSLQAHSSEVERASAPFVRELLDELAFQHNKMATNNARLTAQSLQNADKVKHLQTLLDHSQINTDVIKMGASADIGETNTALNTFGNQSVDNVSIQNTKYSMIKERSVSPNTSVAHSEEQKAELDRMRKEKHEMNQKLEEFAQIMRDFQANQQMQAEENGQLKIKIDQLEHAKRNNGVHMAPPDDYDNM